MFFFSGFEAPLEKADISATDILQNLITHTETIQMDK